MVYDYLYQMCLCQPGFVWNLGKCNPNTECPANSVWNGVICQCNSGFVMYQGQCAVVAIPIPICPANSFFNGVFCTCDDGFH